MSETRQSFWVGLFVLVGLAALGTLIVLFGQAGFWTRGAAGYVLNVRFERATGIRKGTIATVGGIPVGRVNKVDFVNPDRFEVGVNVEIAFDPGYQLRKGSRAKTSEPGLGEGRPPIRIEPGPSDAALLASGEIIQGEISSAVEQLIPQAIVANFDKTATRIGELAGALTPVADDIHEILRTRGIEQVDQPGGPPGNLVTLIARLDSSAKHFNDVLGDPEVKSRVRTSVDKLYAMSEDGKVLFAEMKETARELREATVEGKTLIETASRSITRIDENFEHVARSFNEDLEILSRVLTRLHTVIEKLERGEGTIGRLLTDERLHESLVLMFRRLAETVEELCVLIKDWRERGVRTRL